MVSSEFFPSVTMVLFFFLLPSGENSPQKMGVGPGFKLIMQLILAFSNVNNKN
jgi:hypothetical protein